MINKCCPVVVSYLKYVHSVVYNLITRISIMVTAVRHIICTSMRSPHILHNSGTCKCCQMTLCEC